MDSYLSWITKNVSNYRINLTTHTPLPFRSWLLVGEDFLYDGHVVTDEPALEDLSLRGRDARVERAQFPQAHDLVAEGRARVLRGLQNEDIQE